MHKKIEKLLEANGLNAHKSKILNSRMVNGKTILTIECDDVTYEVDGLNKRIIDDKPKNDNKHKNDYKVSKTETHKPRGWHFRPVYVDENGDVYFKGKLQPELKGKYDLDGNIIEN